MNNTDHLCRQTLGPGTQVDATWYAPHTQTQLQYTCLMATALKEQDKEHKAFTWPLNSPKSKPTEQLWDALNQTWTMEAPIVTCRICCQCPGAIWWHHRTPLPVSMTCLVRVKSDPWWRRHGSDLFWHVSQMLHQISIWGVSRQGWHLELFSSCLSHCSWAVSEVWHSTLSCWGATTFQKYSCHDEVYLVSHYAWVCDQYYSLHMFDPFNVHSML